MSTEELKLPQHSIVPVTADENSPPFSTHSSSTPVTLRRSFIFLFALSIAAICVITVVLWFLSRALKGFNVEDTNRYILAYGPTAVLIWIVAVWRQLDYQVKIHTPWQELGKGNALVSESLLADYVSSLQPITFWKAIRNNHWSVVSTVLGFIFLKLATLSSTALLVLEPVVIQTSANGTTQTILASKSFDANNDTSIFDQSLSYTTYGILVEGLAKPFGLGDGIAYPTFDLPANIPLGSNLSITLPSFVPTLECFPANITSQLTSENSSEVNPAIRYQLISPGCFLPQHSQPIYALNPKSFLCPDRQLSGVIQNINCSSSVFPSNRGVYKLLTVADIRYFQELSADQSNTLQPGSSIQASSWRTEIAQISASVCRLSYSMQDIMFRASAAKFESTMRIGEINGTDMRQLDGFSDNDLDSLFRGALSAGDSILGNPVNNGYASEYPGPMFEMMASTINGTYADLLNTSTLMHAASQVSVQLSAQIAHQYLREASPNIQPLTIQYNTYRLGMDTLSAWAVSALLLCVLFILVTRFIAIKSTRTCSTCAVLKDILPVLSDSSAFASELLSSQQFKEDELHRALEGVKVRLAHQSGESATISLDKPLDISLTERVNGPESWWQPMTIGWPFLIGTLVLTIFFLATLEILQRISDANAGFMSLDSSGSGERTDLIRLLPATLALILASLYNCIEFNTVLMSPFYKMRSGTPASVLSNRPMLGRFPLMNLWTSFRGKYWAALASSLAALVGSLMTIVISGLYSVDILSDARSVIIRPSDELIPFWSNSALNDNGAALLSSLLENSAFEYPTGTYDEITIPMLEVENSVEGYDYTTMTATLPAWRAHLQCVSLSQSNISLSTSGSFLQNTAYINATYELPPNCQFGGQNGTDPFMTFSHTFTFPTNQNTTEVGKLLDLHVGPFDPATGGSQDEIDPSATKDNALGCPSLAFIYGSVNTSASLVSSSQSNIVNVDVCYQQIQRLNTLINFNGEDFAIDPAKPPFVNESSVEFAISIQNTTTFSPNGVNATAFEFRPQAHFDETFAIFNTTNSNPFSSFTGSNPPVDSFFQGVFFGRSPLPLTLLSLTSVNQTVQVQQGISSFYRRYMAQAMSLNMRFSLQNSVGVGPIVASAPQAVTTRRVVQHRTSKIVLQSMLGFMLIMGMTVVSTIRMRRLLPACANPCTIWGQMSLLAGSSYVRGEDSEQKTGTERVQEHEMVRLGWWELADGRRWYGIDVVP